ncbi:hypothetical protein [Polaribacter porphyrae]|uniref:PepSY domain-containing protein n=1 Tax=Polaribacter porphyrae TaxID=1137780 RepID=A0A2S7WT18_9FLAO|nr:hypothetical protein [Polaribacter porphyrae]PQJ80755.1 hypothetical protein BTO18_16950 [Polaribacter porphyrae]
MKKILLILLLIFSGLATSQQKFEKEYRIKQNEAPQNSIDFINNINFKNKIKWYVEESNDGKSFEAKTCHLKYFYSIEFNEQGNLIDVEKKVRLQELSKEVQQKLKKEISKRFKKFKFKKIQIQYKGLKSEVNKVFQNISRDQIKVRVFYEIIVKGKKDKQHALYEMTFDEKGNFLKELKFKSSNSLNLEF